MRRRTVLLASAAAMAVGLSGCGSDSLEATGDLDEDKLTIYSAQHENLTEAWGKAFQEETGIEVQVRYGNDSSMGAQIVEEGESSPADVFLTENSPAMTTVQNAGLLAEVDGATIDQVEDRFVPSSNEWVGIAARSTVLVYNPSMISEDELPASIMDLADEEYAGQWSAAAGGADFQAIVSAILQEEGEEATAEWLAALKSDAKVYQNNIATMKAVNEGQSAMGIIYHYYWYRDQALEKVSSGNTALHYFRGQDPGAFVSVSGGGVVASSDRQEDAQAFLAYVTSPAGQEVLMTEDVKEYAVGKGDESDPALPTVESLEPPDIDPFTLDQQKVLDLMTEAGLL
ncbi:iron ABC transporter substrate-binding protein [Phycicoccus sp. BSK3Z-2]|uniref:Iron ABC transporter substrate-binding protein n=1 Tax=Phycicoccus avicenniae TaxID=2828860 RepID=A0A941DD44_9MICO|nr:iron ABC transporter substrate-binding protein [Phycicoccus avicenniae]MBR7744782.1 iron ABC transporter substrate-binding protein [Phycicoccus avicenniae]